MHPVPRRRTGHDQRRATPYESDKGGLHRIPLLPDLQPAPDR